MKTSEWIMLGVFVLMLILWAFSALGVDATAAALVGVVLLLLTGVLTWDDLLRERDAWNTMIWFATLLMMAGFLTELGLMKWFNGTVGGVFAGLSWMPTLLGLALIYFYTHYFFAGNSSHAGAMYVPFLSLAIAVGAPPMLAALISRVLQQSVCEPDSLRNCARSNLLRLGERAIARYGGRSAPSSAPSTSPSGSASERYGGTCWEFGDRFVRPFTRPDQLRRPRLRTLPAAVVRAIDGLFLGDARSSGHRDRVDLQRIQQLPSLRARTGRGGEAGRSRGRRPAARISDDLHRRGIPQSDEPLLPQPDGDGYRRDDSRPADGRGRA